MSDYVSLEQDAGIAILSMNRPDKLNALSPEVLAALDGALSKLEENKDLRAVILTGSGKAFVAGADIAAMTDLQQEQASEFARSGHRVFDRIEALPCPVIAAVNGFALGGGCELALACDFIYASSKAKFGQPEVALGIIPGFGGTQRLPRRVGVGLARELIYSGKMIKAEEALRIGLVNAVFEPDALLNAAKKIAQEIASKGPLAVTAAKRAIQLGQDRLLNDANMTEVSYFGQCFGTQDQQEGMAAFLEKRPAKFIGK